MSRPIALTIAGSDSSGGAGVVADLKTFEALGVWGTVAVAAVTAQNSLGVTATHLVPPEVIRAQIAAVARDLGVGSVKTGMLGSADGVRAAAAGIHAAGIPFVVVDPVLISKHGDRLLAADAIEVLVAELLPLATIVTPNLPEASALVGFAVESREAMVAAAEELCRLGPDVVLVKGGHLADDGASPDLVFGPRGMCWLEGPRLAVVHSHGTGCVLSAAVAGYLALGQSPGDACRNAKRCVTAALARGGPTGKGIGAVDPGGLGC